ncbi:MAG: DUF3592 domain-containing protein [Pseudomonadales bacterium]
MNAPNTNLDYKFDNKSSAGKKAGAFIAFGTVFAFVGAAMLYWMVIKPISSSQASESWEHTSCEISYSQLKTHRGSDSTTYSPDIVYEYWADGVTRTSSKIDFSAAGSTSDYQAEQAVVNNFPVGASVPCYFNPGNPNEAVLSKDLGRGMWKWISIPFSMTFLLAGLGVIGMGVSARKKAALQGSSLEAEIGALHSKVANPDQAMSSVGFVVLAPGEQRAKTIRTSVFFALFWNAITAIPLFIAYSDYSDNPDNFDVFSLGTGLFLVPFVLVGFFLIWNIFKQIRNLKAPQVSLRMKTRDWTSGESVRIEWKAPEEPKFSELQVFLCCEESATYRRGTNTTTETKVVSELPMCKESVLFHQGRFDYDIPEGLMPSFASDNNEVRWRIQVKAIGTGPSADDQYDITMSPGR